MTPNGWKMSQGMPDRYTAYRLRAKFLAGNLLTPGEKSAISAALVRAA